MYNEPLQKHSRQFGRPLTQEQARLFGFDRQVLQQTIAEAALDEETRRMGLGQADAETLRAIRNDPNFKGVNGQFDPARFAAIIRQAGTIEAPSAETLAAYFEERKVQFRAPEYRKLSFAMITPEEIAASVLAEMIAVKYGQTWRPGPETWDSRAQVQDDPTIAG